MFPNFPYLTEVMAAERAAEFRRSAEAFRRTRRIERTSVVAGRAGLRRHLLKRMSAAMAGSDSRAPRPI